MEPIHTTDFAPAPGNYEGDHRALCDWAVDQLVILRGRHDQIEAAAAAGSSEDELVSASAAVANDYDELYRELHLGLIARGVAV